jgi:hypothetical protein
MGIEVRRTFYDQLSFTFWMISSFQNFHKKQDEKTIRLQEGPEWDVGTWCNYYRRQLLYVLGKM